MKIYLAGPMTGCSHDEACGWRNQIKEALPEHQFLDPVDFGYNESHHESHFTEIVEGDIVAIDESDFVIATMTRPSIGTAMELWHCHMTDKPVVWIQTFPHPWMMYVATVGVCDVEEAIALVKGLALDNPLMRALLLGTDKG